MMSAEVLPVKLLSPLFELYAVLLFYDENSFLWISIPNSGFRFGLDLAVVL